MGYGEGLLLLIFYCKLTVAQGLSGRRAKRGRRLRKDTAHLWAGWGRQAQLLWRGHLCNNTRSWLCPTIPFTLMVNKTRSYNPPPPPVGWDTGPLFATCGGLPGKAPGAWWILTSEQGPRLPACQLQFLRPGDLAWK